MALLRSPAGHEFTVPDAAIPYFPDHEVLDSSVPPRSGRGSGDDAWRSYAADNGVTVADDAKREQIIAALDEAGVPTE